MTISFQNVTVPFFVIFAMIIFIAGGTAEACEECTYIITVNQYWCTYTDCSAAEACVTDHRQCWTAFGCTGSIPAHVCAQYPSAPPDTVVAPHVTNEADPPLFSESRRGEA